VAANKPVIMEVRTMILLNDTSAHVFSIQEFGVVKANQVTTYTAWLNQVGQVIHFVRHDVGN
jgi:hypothetical protein